MATLYKGVLRSLTSGMYDDCRTLFREYVQNAADSIDHAIENGLYKNSNEKPVINILIDRETRKITITDNGTGIPSTQVEPLLADVVNSNKIEGKDKGYKGIGRLGGLSYCNKLVFTTTAKNDNKLVRMIWDGVKLNQIYRDKTNKEEAGTVLDSIITYETESCNMDDHFFKVELENVHSSSDTLLDVAGVKEYLQEVIPIPYANSFMFHTQIYEFAEKHNFSICRYTVRLNEQDLFRPYSDRIYAAASATDGGKKKIDEIKHVRFKIFYSTSDPSTPLAWLWYGVSQFPGQIAESTNKMRGLRIRLHNIEVGNYSTASRFFKEPRGTGYFIGEIHIVEPTIEPNARRDYFESNDTLSDLETQLKNFCTGDLTKCYRTASEVRKSIEAIQRYQETIQSYNDKKEEGFISENQVNKLKESIKAAKQTETVARQKLEKLAQRAGVSRDTSFEDEEIPEDHYQAFVRDLLQFSEQKPEYTEQKEHKFNFEEGTPKKFIVQDLSAYAKKEQKLIAKIFDIIYRLMEKRDAEELISKIHDELKSSNR